MQKISVCIIGFNEEKKITNCLRSVAGVADEIIFVDSYSTDKTVSLVKRFTKKIFFKKFKGYVEQKNFALTKAKNNWILSIDCDEELTEELQKEINDFKKRNLEPDVYAYTLNRITFYVYRWIKHSGWYPDRKIRLFDKTKLSWQGDKIHEKLECHRENLRHLRHDLRHYSFDSIADHIKTIQNFSEIAAAEAFARGKKSSLMTILFRSLWVGIRKFFFEFSFLDGVAGILITGFSMMATWSKYSKLYILNLQANRNPK